MLTCLRMLDHAGNVHPPFGFLRYKRASERNLLPHRVRAHCANCEGYACSRGLLCTLTYIGGLLAPYQPTCGFLNSVSSERSICTCHIVLSVTRVLFLSHSQSRFLSRSLAFFLSRSLSRARARSLSLPLSLPPSLARRGGSRRLARMRVCVCAHARAFSLPLLLLRAVLGSPPPTSLSLFPSPTCLWWTLAISTRACDIRLNFDSP